MEETSLELVVDRVTQIIANVARMNPADIHPYENLIEIGADSIILTDVNSLIRDEFQIEIPLTLFFEELTTVHAIAEYISNHSAVITDPRERIDAIESSPEMFSDSENARNVFHQDSSFKDVQTETVGETTSPFSQGLIGQLLTQQLEVINNQLKLLATNEIAASTLIDTPINKQSLIAREKNVASPIEKKKKKGNQLPYQSISSKKEGNKAYVPFTPLDLEKKKIIDAQQKQHTDALINQYTGKTKGSKQYAEKYRLPYADWRNISGFKPNIKEMVYQLVFQDSKGSKVTDIDGNGYIDLAMDFGASLFGHNAPFIKEAITEELKKGFPLSLISHLSGEVATLICQMTGVERVAFFNSGTEAVMVAMRLARAATEKKKIVMFSGAYHGTFDGVLGMACVSKDKAATPIARGILKEFVEDLVILDYGDQEALDFIVENGEEIAAVLVEPVQSRRPDLQPRAFLHTLRELTKQQKITLIFDEMITGFRLGVGGAQAYYGIQADLVTFGKIVGGGMPIGIVSGTSEIMNCLDGGVWNYGDDTTPPYEHKRTFAGGTFCHHPLTMAAAKAVLLKIQEDAEDIYSSINRKTKYLAETLNHFFQEYEIPAEVVYCGSLFRFVLRGNMELFYYHLLDKGIYVWEGRNCFLSYAHTDEDIQRVIDIVKETCLEMKSIFFSIQSKKTNEIKLEEEMELKLTIQQEQILASEIKQNISVFNQPILLEIDGELETKALNRAITEITRRHEALRYTVTPDYRHFIIHAEIKLPLLVEEIGTDVDQRIEELISKPFDFIQGPLFKVYLLIAEEKQAKKKLLVVAHHLIADGWSLSLFCEELIKLYNSIVQGKQPDLQRAMSFRQYVTEREAIVQGIKKGELKEFWETYLLDCDENILLPSTKMSMDSDPFISKRITFRKEERLLKQVRKLAATTKTSPFIVFLSIFQLMVGKLSSQQHFAIGVPIAGQQSVEGKALVGNCASVMPMTTHIGKEDTFLSLVKHNLASFKQFSSIHYCSLDECSFDLSLPQPTLNILFNMDRMPTIKEFSGTKVDMLPVNSQAGGYQLFFNLVEFKGEIIFDIDYNEVLFSKEMVTRWFHFYLELIEEVAEDLTLPLEDIYVLSDYDKRMTQLATEATINDVLEQAIPIDVSKYGVGEKAISLYIADKQGLPVITGTIGYLYVGRHPLETYNTGWLGRISVGGKLEVIAPENQCLIKNGKLYNLWLVEQVLKEYQEIEIVYSHVYWQENELHAVIHTKDNDWDGNALYTFCQIRLPHYLVPKKIYRKNKGNAEEGELLIHHLPIAPRNKEEEKVAAIFKEVLGIDTICIDDNFFELGGHSLRAIKAINLMEASFGIRLPLWNVFVEPTVRQLAKLIKSKEETAFYAPIPKIEMADFFPMSSSQKRLFVMHEMMQSKQVYNIPAAIEMKGSIDTEKLEYTFTQLINRHENLRTSFHLINGEPVQKVEETVPFAMEYESYHLKDGNTVGEAAVELLEKFVLPFPLHQVPLFRVKLVQFHEEHYLLLFDIHHIVADGESINIIMREFTAIYNGYPLSPQHIQYKDFSKWMEKREMVTQKNFWNHQFQGELPILHLPLDFPRPPAISYRGKSLYIDIPFTTKSKVQALAKKTSTTEYMVLLASFMIILQKYTRQEDMIIGSPVSGRFHPDTENIVGMFVNTLPMRGKPEEDKTFVQFLQEMKDTCLQAFENQAYPLENLLEEIDIIRDVSRNPLFDVLFTFQNIEDEKIQAADLVIGEIITENPIAKFDINMEVTTNGNGYLARWEYSTDLFKAETIQQMANHFNQLLAVITDQYQQQIKDLDVVTEEEKWLIKERFNNTEKEWNYHPQSTIIDLFESQVEQSGNRVAVVFENERLTYEELNQRANSLANQLRDLGVGYGNFVPILYNRSLEMIVAIMGVVKSGAAYVPIDPTIPKERIQYMVQDCHAKVMVSNLPVEDEYINIPVIPIYRYIQEVKHIQNPIHVNTPNDLLYAIYTSGTTGEPKGVLIKHESVMNLCFSLHHRVYDDTKIPKKIALVSPYYFDASVKQIFTSLLFGHTLHVISEERRYSEQKLVDYFLDNELEISDGTPTHVKMLFSDNRKSLMKLEKLLIGGEELPTPLVHQIVKDSMVQLFNVYGPTEATVDTTIYLCNSEWENIKIPIGKPIDNTQVFILNGLNLCGLGIPGELCIAGNGVAEGYLNRAELTAEKFIVHPFGEGMLYRTGDLAKWRIDGNIDYLGRIDEQVKIRGFRIELGEIEHIIRTISGVKDAAVTVWKDSTDSQSLCGYIVLTEPEGNNDRTQFREKLLAILPDYMVPTNLMFINELPITKNGKIDKKKLPKPTIQPAQSYMAPETAIEEKLQSTFEQVLGIQKIGIDDNFFDLGGDSIKAIRICSKLRAENVDLQVKDIMMERTIRKIAKKGKKLEEVAFPYSQEEVKGVVKLTPIQNQFFRWKLEKPSHYNQAIILKSERLLQASMMEKALEMLTKHHDILRAIYKEDGTQEIIRTHACKGFELYEFSNQDISTREEIEIFIFKHASTIQQSMQLSKGPLVKAVLFKMKEADYFMLCIHHLVVDGVSWRILLEDLETLYNSVEQGVSVSLPAKTAAYQEWAEALYEYSRTIALKKEMDYWLQVSKESKLGEILGTLRDSVPSYTIKTETFGLNRQETENLLFHCGHVHNTEINDLLLTALVRSINKWTGQTIVSIFLEGHGREAIHKPVRIDRTVGWFTSKFPVVFKLEESLEKDMYTVKETIRKIPNNGIGYSVLKYIGGEDLPDLPIDICFNYLGDFDQERELNQLLKVTNLSPGECVANENVPSQSITMNAMVSNSCLMMDIVFNEERFSQDEIGLFRTMYHHELLALIDYCMKMQFPSPTASDFGDDELDMEELNEILSNFN